MALLFCKLSFYRTAILLWLSVSLAGQLLGHPPLVSAAAASSSTSGATTADDGAQQGRSIPPLAPPQTGPGPPLSRDQKRNMLKSNFEKMKHDANELTDLAKALQEELNKSDENTLSVDVIDKAKKIGKLAKKIKGSAQSF